jgi:hypothetical protein
MFYLLLVIGYGLAASYLLPITHKKGAGGEINSKLKMTLADSLTKFKIQEFLPPAKTASYVPMPNAQFKNCLFSKTVF